MKKQFVLFCFAAFFSIAGTNAQSDGGQRQTAEERTKAAMEKLDVFNLEADAKTKTEAAIADYYNAQQKAIEVMRASGAMNRDSMRAKRKVLADERDTKLKAIFTPDQMKKWTDEIEPSLRPQRASAPGTP